jgi:hypothetical protein
MGQIYTLGERRFELHPEVAAFVCAGRHHESIDSLVASMQEHGYQSHYPLIVLKGESVDYLIDGARRLEAAGLAGIESDQIQLRWMKDNESVFKTWWTANLARRHYTSSARACMAVERIAYEEERAKARQGQTGQGQGEALEIVASLFNTNAEYVRLARHLKELDVIRFQSVLQGVIKLKTAHALALASPAVRDLAIRHSIESASVIEELEKQAARGTDTFRTAFRTGHVNFGKYSVPIGKASAADLVTAQREYADEARWVNINAKDYHDLIIEVPIQCENGRVVVEDDSGAVARWLKERGMNTNAQIKIKLTIKGPK